MFADGAVVHAARIGEGLMTRYVSRWAKMVGVGGVVIAAVLVVSAAPTAEQMAGSSGPGPVPSATGLILGQVVDADSGRPIAGATVTLTGGQTLPPAAQVAAGGTPTTPNVVSTNGQGQYLFRSLAKGDYTLSADATGYLPSSYGQRRAEAGAPRSIEVADGQRVLDATIRMWKVGVITGRVVDEIGDPLVGVSVRAIARESSGRMSTGTTANTDDRGMYRISRLLPGDYIVVVPYTTSALPKAVADATVSGTSAVARQLSVDVSALGLGNTSGVMFGDMQIATSGITGGTAQMTPVQDQAGRFRAYPTTYFPSALSLAGAGTVRVVSGLERSGTDIRMALVPVLEVSGSVTGPEGPMPNMGLRLTPVFPGPRPSDPNLDTAVTATGPDGRFRFLGVPPGDYEVRALRIPRPQTTMSTAVTVTSGSTIMGFGTASPTLPPVPPDPTLWGTTPVRVIDRDVTGVVVSLRTGTRMSGRIVFDGGPPPLPAERPRLGVILQGTSDRMIASAPAAPVDEDLRFTTPEYPNGEYFVQLTSVPGRWNLMDARIQGVNALVQPFTIDGATSAELVITLSMRPTRITGSVRGSDPGDPNAVVIAVPADVRAWVGAGMPTRAVRRVDVRPNGQFEIANLIPGTYSLVAVPGAAFVDTRSADVMEQMSRAGTPVEIALGDQKTVALTVMPLK